MTNSEYTKKHAAAPVNFIPSDDPTPALKPGPTLCLSGGGYRAMVFHLGALLRLNEAGILPRLVRISSVSGGSITAAMLGLKWKKLGFENGISKNLATEVINPVRALAGHTIDVGSILGGLALPGVTISDRIVKAYTKHLYGSATLQDLPLDEEGPRFVINATSVQSGALWRFSRPFMADYRVGMFLKPAVPLAEAVASSSAFPPVLSPVTLDLRPYKVEIDSKCPLQKQPQFLKQAVLSDGGVYDNLGLETVWKSFTTVLVSDGGGKMQPEEKPHHDWARHALRVNAIIDNQVRSLRKRQLIAGFKDPADEHDGTYWGIRTHIADYGLGTLECPDGATQKLAEIDTRLARMDDVTQQRLINWGYAVCDAALRKHVLPENTPCGKFPYPGGVG